MPTDGTLSFYISGSARWFLAKVLQPMFPDLFKPLAAIAGRPAQTCPLPAQFLQLQAAMFAAYHMTDPKGLLQTRRTFWEIPVLGDKPMEP